MTRISQTLRPLAKRPALVIAALGLLAALLFSSRAAHAADAGRAWALKATASSSCDRVHGPGRATDGNLATGWQADGRGGRQWLEIDLGRLSSLSSVEQTFAREDVWKFTIEGSLDNRNWATLADRSQGAAGTTFSCDVSGAFRYLRLVILGSASNAPASSREFTAQGSDQGTNIALGKPVSSSSSAANYAPEKAVDENTSTYWGASSAAMPQRLEVDLKAPSLVTRVVQNFKDDDTYKFTIEASRDNAHWTMLLNDAAGATGEQFRRSVNGIYRYVRLTLLSSASGYWAGSTEFGVYGYSSLPWTAVGSTRPQLRTVDLGGLTRVRRVRQTFARGGAWRCALAGSADRRHWTLLRGDRSGAAGTACDCAMDGEYRYIRLSVPPGGRAASSRALEVFGTPLSRNLAVGVNVTSSSLAGGNETPLAVDGSSSTYWKADSAAMPQWLTLDLGNDSLVSRVQQSFAAVGAWRFTIEGSADKARWTMLLNHASGHAGRVFTGDARGTYRYIRLKVLAGPPGVSASSRELKVFGIGSPVTDRWWEDSSGIRKFYTNFSHVTLKDIQSQLDTLKSEGYGAVEVTSLPEAVPNPFAGLAALNEFKVDPRAGTMQDFQDLIHAAHARGMRVLFFANPGYSSDRAPFFIKAEKDYRNNVNSPERSWFVFRPAPDGPGSCKHLGNDWFWSDTAGACYLGVWGADAPSFDFTSPSWRAVANRYVRFWRDTGIDGMTFDAAYLYYGITTAINNAVITDPLLAADAYSRAEGSRDAGAILDRHYRGVEAYSWAYLALNTHNPSGLEDYAKTLRDPIVNVHGVLAMPPAWDTPCPTDQRLLEIATTLTTGAFFYLNENNSDWGKYMPERDLIPKWPAADQETLWRLMRAQNNYRALAPVGARFKLPTNDDNKYYAYLRNSKRGGVKALVILNYQDSPQTITVNLANVGIRLTQTPIDLLRGGAAAPIASQRYTVTLPAYGFAVLGMH